MVQRKLIAVDLDGTLFGADHQVSPRTADALHAVAERGHAIVVVTGRTAHSAIPRLNSIPAQARVVCSNGAYEFNRYRNVKHWSQALPASVVIDIHRRILQDLPDASFGWESPGGLAFDEQFIAEAGGISTLEQGGNGGTFGESDLLKLYVRTPQYLRGELQMLVQPLLAGLAEVSTSGAPFVELTACGVDKASGLATVATDLGMSADRTIAFGDNLNDMPMLCWAGESVAMGNAMEEVKAIADTHTIDHAEHGVAVLLEQRLGTGEL